MKRNALLLGLLMTGTVLNSAALTVSRIRGAAWIGQPLSLSVAVQMDSATIDPNLCAEADVYYADALQDPARVRVHQTPDTQGNIQVVQIDSVVPIDEPMVTVYLRVGCGQKVSRRYVLLADFPSVVASTDTRTAVAETVVTSQAIDTPTALQATPTETAAPTASTDASAARTDSPAATRASPQPTTRKVARAAPEHKPAKPVPAATPPKPASHPTAAPAAAAPAAPQRARLKLDPLENLSERIKTLETTTTAIPLEDMVRDAQRVQQLQGDVKKLLDQATANEAKLSEMRARLEKAEAERVSSTLVYALAALVLACLAAIAVLWNRRSPGKVEQHTWSASQHEEDDEPAPVVHHTPPPHPP